MKWTIEEGSMPFLSFHTWYRIVTPEVVSRPPLILLHGGPGSTHNYFEVLDDLAEDGRKIVMYDQLGCGNSYIEGHSELWNSTTWIEELEALIDWLKIDRFHILGQSWGGMMLLEWLIERKPKGICSAILSSTLSSSKLWSKEQHRMIHYLPEEEQRAIAEAEQTNDFSSEAYRKANEHFMHQHCTGPYTDKDPLCLRRAKKNGSESYLTAWGVNEYCPTGTLKDFDYTDRLAEIHVPSLIFSGTDDLCTPLIAKTLYDGIPLSRWELIPCSRHMCFVDQHDLYESILRGWLKQHD